MKLLSVNVGLPREVEWNGKIIRTSIFKAPVSDRVRVAKLNLKGDQQSDLSVDGGIDKAVYAYPSEHSSFWRKELPGTDLPWGAFGENFITEGLLEETVHIGDRLRVGSAEFVVTQPRMPCFKLGIRFGRPDIVKRFLQSGRSGFYFAVLREGEVAAGDSIELLERDEHGITVSNVVNLYRREMLRIRIFCVASASCLRFQKAGETTFVSVYGTRTTDGSKDLEPIKADLKFRYAAVLSTESASILKSQFSSV